MADKKISQLTALAAANLAPSTDVLAIVDTSATETKKIVAQDLINGVLNVASAVGIGTASPAKKLDVSGTGRVTGEMTFGNDVVLSEDAYIYSLKGGSGVRAGFFLDGTNQAIQFRTATTEKMRLDSSGNLGLGVTPSAWTTFKVMQLGNFGAVGGVDSTSMNMFANTFYDGAFKRINAAAATRYRMDEAHSWFTAGSSTANSTISFTQAMTLDADGRLIVGATSAAGANFFTVERNSTTLPCAANITGGAAETVIANIDPGALITLKNLNTTNNTYTMIRGTSTNGSTNSAIAFIRESNSTNAGSMAFGTTNSSGVFAERARITSGGALLVGTTNADPVSSDVVGVSLGDIDGLGRFSRDGGDALQVNRKTSDGNLVRFFQAGAEEGSISVSGNTVSYNAFAGSHWSQLQDGSKPDILRGTVMESINELCVWPGEQNERLPKSKISDTAGSKKVYGVFMAWDNDWTETNDMYVTAVGAFICRVNGSVTVQEGDLLESNGDGTARVQADDIIRSSTIGKVTSTVKTHQYDDGSYCVPTVLYCG